MYEKYVKRRDELGLNDYKVAKNAGIGTCTLSQWKKHHETNGDEGYQPKLDKLTAIASALDMKVSDLIE